VSVEAAKWGWALRQLGCTVTTVAGAGRADRIVAGLGIDDTLAPAQDAVDEALADAGVVVVENLCSLPMNPAAGVAVARSLRGRRAVMHHHDLPWQRARYAAYPPPPDDPDWVHVVINDLSRHELAQRGIAAVTIRNGFALERVDGAEQAALRAQVRRDLGLGDGQRLLLQPTRAIPRKNVPAGLALADHLGAVYWLLGQAEDGYGDQLARVLAGARTRVIHTPGRWTAEEAYAACDAVTLPSTWEGFGNATVESAVQRRPLAIGDYPVAAELATYGFRWFPADDPALLDAFLRRPDPALLAHNEAIAFDHFNLADLPPRLEWLFREARWDL
jgi:glycosyltransferase involved in cell wall biosynthesis